ncbi:ComEC family competence protein [Pedobacter sp. PAMC26386]|nr:ComEC family competence protein [Pedobacter sp. PAMC26386]
MQHTPGVFGKILLPFCIGIWVLHGAENTKLNLPMLFIAVFTFLLLLVINLLYRLYKVYNHKFKIAILINLFFFCLGYLRYMEANQASNPNNFSLYTAEFLCISITSEPQQKSKTVQFKARVHATYVRHQKQHTTGYLLVTIPSDLRHPVLLNYGEVYFIPAGYKMVNPPYNPAEFNFKAWLALQNIHYQIFLQPQELVSSKANKGSTLTSFALDIRQQQVELYRRLIKDDNAFAVASTLILGYRTDLNAETLAAYSKTGTIHALSVSGMHVGIIYFVLNRALQWMDRKRILKWVKVIILLTLIWSYALLTGYSASVLRSAVMLSMFILARAIQQNPDSYHILYFSAFCLLIYNPFLLWDVGFQLSYLSILGLIYLQPRLEKLVSFKSLWLKKLWSLITVSIAAQVFTYPLSAYYFHQFPVYFILSNLFITLPVILLMYIGIILIIFRLYWISPLFEWLIILMNRGLEKIATLPYSSINAIWYTKTELFLLCAFLFFLFAAISLKSKKSLAVSLVAFSSFQSLLAGDKFRAERQQKIIPFIINRSYALAFIKSNKAVLITDLLPNDKAFKFHIQPALDKMKIHTITCLQWNKDINTNDLVIKDHQLVFGNFKMLLLDSSFNHQRVKGKPVFDAIWIRSETKVKMNELREDISFKRIWIDTSNRNFAVQRDKTTSRTH